MPTTVDDALNALDGKFEDIEAMVESKVVKHYLGIKRWESNWVKEMDTKEVRFLQGCSSDAISSYIAV
ncbi:uncharacterized protein EURHEDRAFT_415218, partial [Aspergillus ruber CBS 135680]